MALLESSESVATRVSLSGPATYQQKLTAPVETLSPAEKPLIDLKERAGVRRLFELEQIEVNFDEADGALWAFMRPDGRPSYNLALLDDIHTLQRSVVGKFAAETGKLRYLIAGSRTPGVFSLGGDLDLFATSIRQRNRQALIDYGKSCVRVLHRFHNALDLPIVTIGLAQGDALGGGLESLLSFNVIIAERGAKFGFPEIMFGLFPGMGAYSLVARRTTAVFAEKMMLSGKCFTADEMKELGLVQIVAEPGQGIAAAREYMQRNKGHHAAIRGVFGAGREVNPISLDELDRIVQIWADACLELGDRDLKVMQRLVSAQDKLRARTGPRAPLRAVS